MAELRRRIEPVLDKPTVATRLRLQFSLVDAADSDYLGAKVSPASSDSTGTGGIFLRLSDSSASAQR